MSLPSVYFESTIPSYLVAKASRDHVLRGQQEATRRWWDEKRAEFSCHVSAFVEIEIVRGHPDAAEKCLKSIAGIPRLASSPEVMHLAERILASGLIPLKAAMDASHIAVATVHGMELLLTWNCTHIHNVFIHRRISRICALEGYECPEICTPFDLL